MAAPNQLDLLIDAAGNRLLQSFTSTRAATTVPAFTFGDTLPVTVRVLTPNPTTDTARPWREIDLTNQNIRLGVGTPAGDPSSGTFTLTFDSNTTTSLNYNATAAQVQTALNALTTIQSAGNTTVTTAGGGKYRVVFGSVGARNLITADTSSLYPTSAAYINEAQTGDASTKEVQLIVLETEPSAYLELTDTLDAAAATISTVRAGVANTTSEIQTLDLSNPQPYDGTFTLTVQSNKTSSLAYNASAATLQAALIATDSTNLTGKITVTGAFPLWTVEFDNTLGDVDALTADVSALTVPTGRKGDLNLNVAGIQELLGGSTSAQAKLEVEIYNTVSATSWTPVQTPCTVREDLVPSSPASTTPLPTYVTANDFGGLYAPSITSNITNGAFATIGFQLATTVNGLTANTTTNKITAATNGTYLVQGAISGTATSGFPWRAVILKNGTGGGQFNVQGTSGRLYSNGSVAFQGIGTLVNGDTLELAMIHTGTGNLTFTALDGSLAVTQLPTTS